MPQIQLQKSLFKSPLEVDTENATERLNQGKLLGQVIFFIMGVGNTFPFHSYIASIDYLKEVYPGRHMARWFTVTYFPATIMTLSLLLRYKKYIEERTRVIVSFAGHTALMTIMPILDASLIRGGYGSNLSYALICIAVGLIGCCDGIGTGALFGEAARLSPEYTRALVQGLSMAGITASVFRLSTKGAVYKSLRASAMWFFAIGVLFCFVCTMLYTFVLPNIQYIKNNLYNAENDSNTQTTEIELNKLMENGKEYQDDIYIENADKSKFSVQPQQQSLSVRQILRCIWREVLSNIVIHIVTLSIVPGFLGEDLQSKTLKTWYPILLIFTHQIAEFIGRVIPLFNLVQKSRLILNCSLSRIVFVFLFGISVYLQAGEFWFFLLTLLLGVSGGYLMQLAMVSAPLAIKFKYAQQMIGNIMVYGLYIGLLGGSLLGWLWIPINL
eukprot:TRINITY_DN4833_c0_g3_i1.p1 TRINITY_DN4833_c0_g3~~TRINITY_DN4833_c0_g3_i1.p1  ORF type:complete len:442 (-),score=18.70 TRINITY_DN4833_c0_g3_i1:404-1729(-)